MNILFRALWKVKEENLNLKQNTENQRFIKDKFSYLPSQEKENINF